MAGDGPSAPSYTSVDAVLMQPGVTRVGGLRGASAPGEDTHASVKAETAIRIAAFLDAHHVMSLATCGPDGPHATNVFYARDGFALLWVSDPNSRHSVALAASAQVAATVAPDYFDFDYIVGMQISGQARIISGLSERTHARRLLEARYPFLERLSQAPRALQEAYACVEFYRLEPTRMVLIDNSRGFGHKDELELGRAAG
jgi:uncharacterized protein YhbP (UPF0306 family)